MLSLFTDQIRVELKTGIDIVDISDRINRLIGRAGIESGSVHATVIGSTGSVTTIEYERGVIEDLKRAINRIAPPDIPYEHEKAWHDGNGHSHVQAAMIGPSIVLQIRDARLQIGTWQQVVIINHDNRPRERKIDISIIGEKSE
ncbi:MAG: secondary thiamine-phosphate synthase enzyme YjbQ [Desulfobacterales bacterium]|nr:secondary thiamine-phosphate synthase enzyme YjbQ [Desulfobacterales bacterium]